MSQQVRCLFVGDSRAHNFNNYIKPSDYPFEVDIYSLRGAKICSLINPTLRKLGSYAASDLVIVRLAAGINDLTTFIRNESGKAVLKPSSHTPDTLLFELRRFREAVLSFRPRNTLVTFTTIPPASFKKFQASRNLDTPIIDEENLVVYQNELDRKLDTINEQIIGLNSQPQRGIKLRTLSWHNTIRKSAKRKRGDTTVNVKRNHFVHLYDGLHATSKLKKRWYRQVYQAFKIDLDVISNLQGNL